MRGPWLHAHPRLGDDAEDSLGAGEHPVGTHAGAGAGQATRLPGSRRGDRAGGLDEVLDVGVQGGEVPGRARGDPATEGGVLEGLGEVAQREAVLGELGLEGRPQGARLDQGRARDGVDLEHAVEGSEVDRDGAVVGVGDLRSHTAHHRCAAAVGDCGETLGRAPLQQPFDIGLVPRVGDEVGGVQELTAKAVDDVGVGLAERVRGARAIVGGADVRQRRRRENPRDRQLELLQRHR